MTKYAVFFFIPPFVSSLSPEIMLFARDVNVFSKHPGAPLIKQRLRDQVTRH
jgi:hypothetical protein